MQKRRRLRGLWNVAQRLGTQTIPVRVQGGFLEEVWPEKQSVPAWYDMDNS